MARGDTITLTIGPPFGGTDVTNSPMSLLLGTSSDQRNTEGDGRKVAKRWGISKELSTAVGGPIYDIAMLSPTPVNDNHSFMHALYRSGASAIGRAAYRPGVDLTDGGTIPGAADAGMSSTQHAGSGNVVLLSGPPSFGPAGRYFGHGTAQGVGVGFYTGPGIVARSDVMAYHRLCMFTARHAWGSLTSRLFYSDPDAPLVWNPMNYVDAQNLGRYPAIAGLHANGPAGASDILYAGGTHNIHAVTGATPATFKMQPTNADFGFAGSRSCDALKGVLYGIACRLGNDTEVPFDIFAAAGLQASRIGEPVRSLVLNTNGGAYTDARTEAWPWRDAVLFMPRRSGASAAARDVIFFHEPSKTFWRWTIDAAAAPNCFDADMGQMWMGCADGRVRYFNQSAANDDGTAFDSYWTSGPIVHPAGRLMRLRRLIIWGMRGGGTGDLNVKLAIDGLDGAATPAAGYGYSKDLVLPTTATDVAKTIDYPDNTPLAYVHRVKLTFAPAAILTEFTKIVGVFDVGDYIA